MKSDSPPRVKSEVKLLKPPLCATARPGTKRSASPTARIWRESISVPDTTVTVEAASERGRSVWAPETTSDSVTAPIRSRSGTSTGVAPVTSTRAASATNPSSTTRTTYAPSGRCMASYVPSAAVSSSTVPERLPEMMIRAPGTGWPSGSVTVPRRPAANAGAGSVSCRKKVTLKQKRKRVLQGMCPPGVRRAKEWDKHLGRVF